MRVRAREREGGTERERERERDRERERERESERERERGGEEREREREREREQERQGGVYFQQALQERWKNGGILNRPWPWAACNGQKEKKIELYLFNSSNLEYFGTLPFSLFILSFPSLFFSTKPFIGVLLSFFLPSTLLSLFSDNCFFLSIFVFQKEYSAGAEGEDFIVLVL